MRGLYDLSFFLFLPFSPFLLFLKQHTAAPEPLHFLSLSQRMHELVPFFLSKLGSNAIFSLSSPPSCLVSALFFYSHLLAHHDLLVYIYYFPQLKI